MVKEAVHQGNRLKWIVNKRDISVTELATKCDLSREYIQQMFNKPVIAQKSLIRILEELSIPYADFFQDRLYIEGESAPVASEEKTAELEMSRMERIEHKIDLILQAVTKKGSRSGSAEADKIKDLFLKEIPDKGQFQQGNKKKRSV